MIWIEIHNNGGSIEVKDLTNEEDASTALFQCEQLIKKLKERLYDLAGDEDDEE